MKKIAVCVMSLLILLGCDIEPRKTKVTILQVLCYSNGVEFYKDTINAWNHFQDDGAFVIKNYDDFINDEYASIILTGDCRINVIGSYMAARKRK